MRQVILESLGYRPSHRGGIARPFDQMRRGIGCWAIEMQAAGYRFTLRKDMRDLG